ncbi:MAG: hypothetical protein KA375_05405 [Vitreoscilla sp.]|nr:hypothetical protein [Burkholderiales bacterium]MBP6337009.1 hypothetical protein [Vitreoscilla sp.]MBP6675199.1 hypothetical protein [Vitreoscilla sp.]
MNLPLRTSTELDAQYVPWHTHEQQPWLAPAPRAQPTLELVDTPAVARALDNYWQCDRDTRQSLLLIDPETRWAPAMMKRLLDQTEGDESRVRVMSPVGVRNLATVHELEMPQVPGRPKVLRSLECRQQHFLTCSPSVEKLFLHTDHVAMLLGDLPPHEASAWIRAAQFVAQKLGTQGPRWLLFVRYAAQEQLRGAAGATQWGRRLRFFTQPGGATHRASPGDMTAAVLEAWAGVDAAPTSTPSSTGQ